MVVNGWFVDVVIQMRNHSVRIVVIVIIRTIVTFVVIFVMGFIVVIVMDIMGLV